MLVDSRKIPTLAHMPAVRAALDPEGPAVVFGERTISFREFEARSNQVARGLLQHGLEPQDRVAILDRNSESFFEVLFGTVKARAVLVTVNFRLTAREVAYILKDSRTRIVLVGAELAPLIESCRDELADLKTVVVLGDTERTFDKWRQSFSSAELALDIDPQSAAVQMYTSGTTGNPKGVELSHRAMVNAAHAGLTVWPFLYERGSAVLATMPLFHIAAANLCIAALFAGARAEVVRDATPVELAALVPGRHISLVPLPATVIHTMLRMPDIRERDFSALKVMLVAGSGIAEELIREATEVFNCGFALSYGSTETCGGVTYLGPLECTSDAGNRLGSAGKVLWESRIRIIDHDGRECEPGEIGEILCWSNRLMNGYWQRPAASAEALQEGWFHSGDAGYLSEDGYLYIVDRIKDMVITGGENVYPTEIEGVMHQHPAVEDVAVVGIPDEKWGESLLAFIIRKSGTDVGAGELESFLGERIARFKVPRKYEFVSEFPRNATGKVLKRELRAPYWKGHERHVG